MGRSSITSRVCGDDSLTNVFTSLNILQLPCSMCFQRSRGRYSSAYLTKDFLRVRGTSRNLKSECSLTESPFRIRISLTRLMIRRRRTDSSNSLVDVDERIEAIGSAVRSWVGESLGFAVRTEGPIWKFGVSTSRPPLLPEPTVHRIGIENFGRSYAVDRWCAEGHAILRPGDPFVDAVLALSLEDDRGLTFARAVFKKDMPEGSDPVPIFAFNFIFEPAPRHSRISRISRQGQSGDTAFTSYLPRWKKSGCRRGVVNWKVRFSRTFVREKGKNLGKDQECRGSTR